MTRTPTGRQDDDKQTKAPAGRAHKRETAHTDETRCAWRGLHTADNGAAAALHVSARLQSLHLEARLLSHRGVDAAEASGNRAPREVSAGVRLRRVGGQLEIVRLREHRGKTREKRGGHACAQEEKLCAGV